MRLLCSWFAFVYNEVPFVTSNIIVENSVAIGAYSEIDFSQKAVLEQARNELFAMVRLCFMTVSQSINALKQVVSI